MKRIGLLALLFTIVYQTYSQVSIVQNTDEVVMSNGTLTVKLDFNSGGAISYLGLNNSGENLVNINDRGRYIQQSYYAGDALNRRANGQNATWSPWPWNPIQVGDCYGNVADLLEKESIGDTFHVKTNGLLWDMNNETPQATLEEWVSFENANTIKVRNKLVCFRTDSLWTAIPREQEMPAVYTIGRLNNLISYTDSFPWICDRLNSLVLKQPPDWAYWKSEEKWAAFVDESFFGLGVYLTDAEGFKGGFSGHVHCKGNSRDGCCGYIAPLKTIELHKTDSIEYTYYLCVGNINVIREEFQQLATGNSSACPVLPQNGFSAFPNPVNDKLSLTTYFDNIAEALVVNMTGQMIIRQAINSLQTSIDTEILPKGTYVLMLKDKNGRKWGAQQLVK